MHGLLVTLKNLFVRTEHDYITFMTWYMVVSCEESIARKHDYNHAWHFYIFEPSIHFPVFASQFQQGHINVVSCIILLIL